MTTRSPRRGSRWRAALAAAALPWLLGATQAPPPETRLPVELVDPRTGDGVRLEAGGALLHMVWFATWCPPCREELPRLAELDARWKDAGYRLVVVAVAARQSVERLREFARSDEVPGRLLFDADGSVQAGFEVEDLPTHLLLDGSGRVVRRAPALDRDLESEIQEIMIRNVRGE